MDHEFRSATFGGFQKQDVLDYLEQNAKIHNEQIEKLNQKLQEQKKDTGSTLEKLALLCTKVEQQEQKAEKQRAEIEQLRSEKQDARAQLEQVRAELAAVTAQRDAQTQELEVLRQKVAELTPNAQAYAEIKDRTAGVELEACRRANVIQTKAEEQVRELHGKMERWLLSVENEYDTMRFQIESTTAHAVQELRKAEERLNQTNALLDERDIELKAFRRDYMETQTKAGSESPSEGISKDPSVQE